jgi:hypothetical protein
MAVLVVLVAIVGSAKGAILVNDWQVNLEALEPEEFAVGDAPPTIMGIDFVTFLATTHSRLISDTGAVGPSDGDVYRVNVLGNVTSFGADPNITINTPGLNGTVGNSDTYQLTFRATVDVEITGQAGTIFTFEHLPIGGIEFWIDGPVGGYTPAGTAGEASFIDGTLIATMAVQAGQGGSLDFDPDVLDGSDDATYSLTSAPIANLLLDSLGADLTTNPVAALLAFVDSNFDMDTLDTQTFSTIGISPWPTAAPTIPATGPGNPAEFFASEDGSVRLAQDVIPEQSSVLVWGVLVLISSGLLARTRYALVA